MKIKLAALAATLAVFLVAANAQTQSENPFIGTWDIDISESDFGSVTAPENMTRSYTDLGEGSYAYQVATVSSDGSLGLTSAIYSYDGKGYPIVSFDELPSAARISYRKINDTTVEYTVKLGDEVSQIGAKFISPNYQQLTISIQYPNTDLDNQILVFNRRR